MEFLEQLYEKVWSSLYSLNSKGVVGPDTQDLCFEMIRLENVGVPRQLQDLYGCLELAGDKRLIDVRHLSWVASRFWCVEDPSLVGDNDCPLRFYMTEEDRKVSSWPQHLYVHDYDLPDEVWDEG